MKREHKSQGAAYVRSLELANHRLITNERRVLHWTPTKSFYVNEAGDVREIWGLARNDAAAYCRMTNVRFRDAVIAL